MKSRHYQTKPSLDLVGAIERECAYPIYFYHRFYREIIGLLLGLLVIGFVYLCYNIQTKDYICAGIVADNNTLQVFLNR